MFGLFAGRSDADEPAGQPAGRRRIRRDAEPALTYAIGDVHGCLDLLLSLEAKIVADAAGRDGDKLIVMLGDYVDRGPEAAGVLDHLLAPPPSGFERLCLLGNHEATMLAFLADPAEYTEWLGFGGVETLASYGIAPDSLERLLRTPRRLKDLLDRQVPPEHRALLTDLPVLVQTPSHLFVHAGLRPGVALAEQSDNDLIWIRDEFVDLYDEFGCTVVHGHTPRLDPLVTGCRIAIDTGAFMTGRLTAVRLAADAAPKILTAEHRG